MHPSATPTHASPFCLFISRDRAVGLRFVEMELKMIESLTSGTALLHHLEPSYFAAMGSAGKDARFPS